MMVAASCFLLLLFVANPCLGLNQLISPFINELIAVKASLGRELIHYEKLEQDLVKKSNDVGLRREKEKTLMQIAFLTKMEWVLTLAQEKFMATVKMEHKLLREMESEVNSLNMQTEIAQNNAILQRDVLTCGSLKYHDNVTANAGVNFTLADLESPNLMTHKKDDDNLDNLRKQLEISHLEEKLKLLKLKRQGMENGIDEAPKAKKKGGGDIITHNHIVNDVKITNKPIKITKIKECIGNCARRGKKRVNHTRRIKKVAQRSQLIHATNAENPSEDKEAEDNKEIEKQIRKIVAPQKKVKGKKKPSGKKIGNPRMLKLAKKIGKKKETEQANEDTQKKESVDQEQNVKEEQAKETIVEQEEYNKEEDNGEHVVKEDNVNEENQNTEVTKPLDNIKEERESDDIAAPQQNVTEEVIEKPVEQEDSVKEEVENENTLKQEDNVKEEVESEKPVEQEGIQENYENGKEEDGVENT